MKLGDLIFLPFGLQAVTMIIDEFYYHWKRGLPKWERIGHPIDSFIFLCCFLFAYFVPWSDKSFLPFVALCLLSCLSITKDEFVHKECCPGAELFVHAFLFVVHSVLLFCIYFIWKANSGQLLLETSFDLKYFLTIECALIFFFMMYQIIYWNFIWKKKAL